MPQRKERQSYQKATWGQAFNRLRWRTMTIGNSHTSHVTKNHPWGKKLKPPIRWCQSEKAATYTLIVETESPVSNNICKYLNKRWLKLWKEVASTEESNTKLNKELKSLSKLVCESSGTMMIFHPENDIRNKCGWHCSHLPKTTFSCFHIRHKVCLIPPGSDMDQTNWNMALWMLSVTAERQKIKEPKNNLCSFSWCYCWKVKATLCQLMLELTVSKNQYFQDKLW